MSVFCAALSATDPQCEVEHLGGDAHFFSGPCALGLITGQRSGLESCCFQLENHQPLLHVAGSIKLFNRNTLSSELDQQPCYDGEFWLKTYAEHGLAGLCKLNGMFGAVIWDGNSLSLVSDPVGSRSIFYTRLGDTWLVSASLRALRQHPRFSARPNLFAAQAFLVFAYVPGELTLLEGVYRVPPGCCLRLFPDGRSEIERYWHVHEGEWDLTDPPEAYATTLRLLLEDAVSQRLPVDQPVGVFLSGGLDSSLVTALAASCTTSPFIHSPLILVSSSPMSLTLPMLSPISMPHNITRSLIAEMKLPIISRLLSHTWICPLARA